MKRFSFAFVSLAALFLFASQLHAASAPTMDQLVAAAKKE